MYQVTRPHIPYKGPITGGLHEGKRIEIRGLVPYGADRFVVNLQTALDSHSDRPLHISVRFDGRVIVRNTRMKMSYGEEERNGPFPFAIGQHFTLVISVQQSGYMITVNGQHYCNYSHRIPFTRVCSIMIEGDVQIHQIDYISNNPYSVPMPVTVARPTNPLYPSSSEFQVPPLPCIFPIYGGIRPGMTINISGRPTASPQKLTINLQSGTSTYPPPDVAFHFDARFSAYSVVRNSRVNNVWLSEENMVSHFPFQPGANFDMQINVQGDAYVVILNGQHFISFRHRLNDFSRFNILNIENDVIVSSVRYN